MLAALAELTRGGVVESVHHGAIVVADTAGDLIAGVGDPDTFAFFRSSAKPFQAIPVIESGAADRFGFTPAELALCCASHFGEPHHQRQIEVMLAKLGLTDAALQCGIASPMDAAEAARIGAGLLAPTPLQSECSGKHTGMLASCLALGYSLDNYLEQGHPLQRHILTIVSEVLRLPESEIVLGIDGCSVPTFGAPLRAFAAAFAALAAPERIPSGHGLEHAAALSRLCGAMLAHPLNVAGTGATDTTLMSLGAGAIVAKTGAEGLLCMALPERGWGVAIRIADGSFRAHEVVAPALLEQLDVLPSEVIAALRQRFDPSLRNPAGRVVGEVRATFSVTVLAT
ncbi:MAG: asparaginase [Chloroflexota bacterium]|nr:asparaginase [Chloroflexota bacterium]